MTTKYRVLLLAVFALAVALLSGCGGTIQAIQNRDMSLSAKMTDTIFLDPETIIDHRNVFVRVTNTSDFQEIDFSNILKNKLASKGFTVTTIAKGAYIVQANLLYMGQEKKDLTADGMIAGGFGGALLGSTVGSGWKGPSLAAAGAGIAGAVAGAVVGSMIHVDTYFGAVDIQIKEPTDEAVERAVRTDAQQGSSTTVSTTSSKVTDKQEYRTRIVVKATQTNINRMEACNAIADRLANQIAGLF
ncbi:MAG: complement resistance protein TraT [Thermodesulfovibrionales bacterium]